MKVRLTAPGWENFTGTLGFQAEFVNGVSVNDLTPRQIARIGSSTTIVDVETGKQVGPSVTAQMINSATAPVIAPMETVVEIEARERDERVELAKAQAEQKMLDEQALADAESKIADASSEDLVIFSRMELEAIGANDGINRLREIAEPYDVRARDIPSLIEKIIQAQNKAVEA